MVDRLRASRAAYLGHLTRTQQEIAELVEAPLTEATDLRMEVLLEKYAAKWENYQRLGKEVVDALEVGGANFRAQIDDEAKRTDDNLEVYLDTKIAGERWRKRYAKQMSEILEEERVERAQNNPPPPPHNVTVQMQAPAVHQTLAKLPMLQLSTFKGTNPQEYFPWINAFDVSVHNNPTVPKLQKFNYLIHYTSDAAAKAISGFSITEENYDEARAVLKNRFGQKEVIKAIHFAGINKVAEVHNRNEVKALRNLYDTLNGHLRSLDTLGVDKRSYADMTKQTLLAKIPNDMAVEWKKVPNNATASLDDLMGFIQADIESREFVAMMKQEGRPEKSQATSQHQVAAKPQQSTASALSVRTQAGKAVRKDKSGKTISCVFCKENHFAVACHWSMEQRQKKVKDENRCIRCLSQKHLKAECPFPRPCRSCGADHHGALCRKVRAPSTQPGTPAVERPTEPPKTNSTSSLTVRADASIFGQVFLKTATVMIQGENGLRRAICVVDGGSERSFVSRKLAAELGLKAVGNETMHVLGIGVKPEDKEKEEPEQRQRREIVVRGTFPDAPTVVISALEQDYITRAKTYRRTAFANELWLQGHKLADDRILSGCKTEEDVELLIGTDYYYQVVKNEKRITSRDGLQAIPSKFGLLLHGPTMPYPLTKHHVVVSMFARCRTFPGGLETDIETTAKQSIAKQSSTTSTVKDTLVDDNPTNPFSLSLTGNNSSTESRPTVPTPGKRKPPDDNDLRAFWEVEHIGIIGEGNSNEDEDPLADYEDRISRTADGRYIAPLPWKDNKSRLQPNLEMAHARLNSQLRNLRSKPNLLSRYHEQIRNIIKDGFATETDPEYHGIHTYLPHHAVVKEDRSTTKVRPVFDGAAKTKSSPSINQCLESGPNITPDLLATLIRFRMQKVAWIADVEKAFHQVLLEEEDQEAIRFLWVEDPFDPKSPVKAYKWLVLPFGLTCSPFMLRAVINKHIRSFENKYPYTVQLIHDQLYVDDLLGGTASLESSAKTASEAIEIFADAKMTMRKWLTNDPRLKLHFQDAQFKTLEGVLGAAMTGNEPTKVLGVGWDSKEDHLFFNPTAIISAVDSIGERPTKRQMLQVSARIYDPLGHLAPVVLLVKILYQHLWEKGVGWDERAPEDIAKEWNAFIAGLDALNSLKIPRWVRSNTEEQKIELHVFCDASNAAYGAVVYTRIKTDEGRTAVQLLCSKTRVAPLSPKQSIPILELLGAVLASNLIEYITSALRNVQCKVTCWTDSRVALAWIQGDIDRWVTFVRNRVITIRKATRQSRWRHCPGGENPADLASRGLPANKLVNSKLWWNGPDWLTEEEGSWPPPEHSTDREVEEIVESKAKIIRQLACTVEKGVKDDSQKLLTKFSSISRLHRVTAWMLRFISAAAGRLSANKEAAIIAIPVTKDGRQKIIEVECLAAEEIIRAELLWIRKIQQTSFAEIYNRLAAGKPAHAQGKMDVLRPFWDQEDKIIRVTGRIQASIDEREINPPILLPSKHPAVDLIIRHTHERIHHAGLRTTLAALREQYWIIKGRQQVKQVLNKCVTCQKLQSRSFNAVSAPMPIERIRESQPFETTGVDFAGPLFVRKETNTTPTEQPEQLTEKVYFCIFTCATTRAIHLELVTDLSAKNFILALRKFRADRGHPSIIYSDNAKTFEKADRYLRALQEDPNVADLLAKEKIRWRFSANLAPWWGGWWERMVRTTKDMLRKTIGKITISYRELETVLKEIADTINCRPLTYVSAEGEEQWEPLTPNHILRGKRRKTVTYSVPIEIAETDSSARAQLLALESRRRKGIADWWKHWQSEYLDDLRRFQTTGKAKRPISVGELVTIHDANAKRLNWLTGVVVRVERGRDGQVRLAYVRMSNGTVLNRPIQRLFPLELRAADPVDETEPVNENPPATEQPESTSRSQGRDLPRECVETLLHPNYKTRRGRTVQRPTKLQDYI